MAWKLIWTEDDAGVADGLATLDASALVVQDPANAQLAPASGKIPKAMPTGKLAPGWIPDVPHAATHKDGGTDEVAQAAPGANAIPKADGAGKLDVGWLPTDTADGEDVVPEELQRHEDRLGRLGVAARGLDQRLEEEARALLLRKTRPEDDRRTRVRERGLRARRLGDRRPGRHEPRRRRAALLRLARGARVDPREEFGVRHTQYQMTARLIVVLKAIRPTAGAAGRPPVV